MSGMLWLALDGILGVVLGGITLIVIIAIRYSAAMAVKSWTLSCLDDLLEDQEEKAGKP